MGLLETLAELLPIANATAAASGAVRFASATLTLPRLALGAAILDPCASDTSASQGLAYAVNYTSTDCQVCLRLQLLCSRPFGFPINTSNL